MMLRHYGVPHNDSVGMWNDKSRGTAVVDVGIIQDRGWAVVEQNAACCSGIYGCDPEEVLEVVRYSSERSCPNTTLGD